MTTLGILSCRIFEDELIYFILHNKEFNQILLFNNENIHETFEKKLIKNNIKYCLCNTYQEINSYLSKNSNSIKILFLKIIGLGLHSYPNQLKEYIYNELTLLNEKTSLKNILLYYGLCGNVLGNVEKDFNTKDFHVFILKEKNGEIVDDCVGAILEGRENYLKLLKSFNKIGTLIEIPMGAITIDHFMFKNLLNSNISEKKAQKMIKKMYDIANYEKMLLLDTGLPYTPYEEAKKKAKDHADKFQLKLYEKKLGSQRLFQENYERIKDRLL